MAVGTIVSLAVNAGGWDGTLVIEGDFTASTAVANGLGTNNALTGVEKLALHVTSLAFNAAGSATTRARDSFGTSLVRKAYPNNASVDATFDATNTTVRIAFSMPIFAKDKSGGGNSGTDITCDMLAGFLTATGKSSLARAAFTVTNNSTLPYPKAIARWAWPGYERITGDFLVEVVGYHPFAWNGSGNTTDLGRSFACVLIDCDDASAHSAVQQVSTTMAPSSRSGDAKTISLNSATVPVTALTQGDVLTVNFKAYPWVGDSTSVLDSRTSADGVAAPSAALTPLMGHLDKNDTLACYASVDGVGAGTPTVQTTAATARTTPYATIASALTALKAFNNTNHSDNSLNNCVILMQNATYTGPGTFTGSNTKSRCIIMADIVNGATEVGVVLSTAANQACAAYLKIQDVSVTGSGAGMFRGSITAGILWVHSCTLNNTSSSFAYQWLLASATQNTITALTQGFLGFSTNKGPWGLVRGNDASGTANGVPCHIYTVIGNNRVGGNTAASSYQETGNAGSNPIGDCVVVGYNQVLSVTSLWANAWAATTSTTIGMAIFGNVGERITDNSQPFVQVCGDNANLNNVSNVYLTHNTFAGQRENLNYQEGGNVTLTRNNWFDQHNLFRDNNTKTDVFANAVRTVTDAVLVSGLATITSVTAAFVAGDVGQIVSAEGLTNGLGVVLSRDSATQITLTANAIASNTGVTLGIRGYIANGARVGNWAWVYGCGCYGSRYELSTFAKEFIGIDSANVGSGSQGYTSDKSVAGTGAGNGDYSLTVGAAGLNRVRSGCAHLPYDLNGKRISNSTYGASGALQPLPVLAVTGTADNGTYDLGAVTVGVASTHQFTLTNSGLGEDLLGTLSISGTGWSITVDNPSGSLLAPSGTTTVTVSLTAVASGAQSGILTIPSNDAASSYVVNLTATAAAVGGGNRNLLLMGVG